MAINDIRHKMGAMKNEAACGGSLSILQHSKLQADV